MKNICFNFQVHQPFRLKRYRFFDIGNDHYYFDDFQNEEIFKRIARESYLPANQMLLDMIKKSNGGVKVSFALSGTAISQIEMYAPELIDSFVELSNTGCVEFLAEPYAHSLSSLGDVAEFRSQIQMHSRKIQMMFGQKPAVFRNTELLYSDEIAEEIEEMGFKGMITEGAKHVLGWKSPNYIYQSATSKGMPLLLRNRRFSDDILKNFSRYDWSEYPLTADKFADWISALPKDEEVIYIDMAYEVFGQAQPTSSGIFDFFKALPIYFFEKGLKFATPSEVIARYKPVSTISIPLAISWSEEEKNTSTWLGNSLQSEAFTKLIQWGERTRLCQDRRLLQDWLYLQSSDHFLYMTTTNKDVRLFSPYDGPYDAFNNYMNILSDFHLRVEAQYPSSIENEELNALLLTIKNQGEEIEALKAQLEKKQKSVKKKV
ncbi:glycoside hydrolase family 57 protein [Porphyromonas sp.]|uniref:glycoside hydrolase family 57 protein n=1 Tax=Porphyromonas sp. TaxID=1924944 RepID=UPI0026DBBBF6|nr:glycoside hydrolase family 57 protein [Porphyromonas sp.]MDO4770505.1 glycoside hydrolase family 57 protein [Porphyromonas sp.]